MKKLVYLIIAIFIAQSCADGNSSSSGSDENPETSNQVKIVRSLSVTPQKGLCLKDGEIIVKPLADGTLNQTGLTFTGYLDENGISNVPVEIAEEYSEIFFEGACNDEVNGGTGNQKLSGIVKSSEISYLNPLTKIRSIVARSLFDDEFSGTYQNVPGSIALAEQLTIPYLGFSNISKPFDKIDLGSDTSSDAVGLAVNSMILHGRTDVEQGDYIVSIANGILNNDQALKLEISETYQNLPIETIKANIESTYGKSPKFWNLIKPELDDLLSRDPVVQGSFNIGDSGSCSADMAWKKYAIPHIFESWIETSRYLATNLHGGNVSIWSHYFGVYDRPGFKIVDVDPVEVKLKGPAYLPTNGKIEGHGIVEGQKVFFVIENEEPFVLTTSCGGGLLPFGRKMFSNDGINWMGFDMNIPWHRKSGIIMFGVD